MNKTVKYELSLFLNEPRGTELSHLGDIRGGRTAWTMTIPFGPEGPRVKRCSAEGDAKVVLLKTLIFLLWSELP